MFKKYKHISDSDYHSDINSSSSVEINTANTHLRNTGSNTDNVENVDNAKNWLMMIELVIFSIRKSPIQFGEAYTH